MGVAQKESTSLFFLCGGGGVKNSHRIQFRFFLKLYELRIAKNTFFFNHQHYFSIFTFGYSILVSKTLSFSHPIREFRLGNMIIIFYSAWMNVIIRNDFPTKPPWIWVNRTYTTVFVTTPSSNFLERFGSLRLLNQQPSTPHVIKTMATTGTRPTGLLHDGLALSVQCTGSLQIRQPWESATGGFPRWAWSKERGVFTKLGWKSRVKWRVWISSFIYWW